MNIRRKKKYIRGLEYRGLKLQNLMILARIRSWRRLSTACDPPSGSERRGRKKSRTKFSSSGGRFHLTVSRP